MHLLDIVRSASHEFVLIIFIMAPKGKRTYKILSLQEQLELIKLQEKGISMTDYLRFGAAKIKIVFHISMISGF